LSSVLAQLGIFGLVLVVLIAGGIWYLRATRDIRDEKEGVIKRLQDENQRLQAEIDAAERTAEKWREGYYACKYPGSRPDPFEHDPEGGAP
jgi:F0F1-type ATP synthase membrane subunit b/b'